MNSSEVVLEPVIALESLHAGQMFPGQSCTLDDRFIDAYLETTGEAHQLYRRIEIGQDLANAGYAPALCVSFVRFAKASLGGRWPTGTLQLTQGLRSLRALRRGERVDIGLRIGSIEQRNGRTYVDLVSMVCDTKGEPVCEQTALLLWGGQSGLVARKSASAAKAFLPSEVGRLGPLTNRFPMERVRAYAKIAGAHDPIHVDPEFARTTPIGVNIAQAKLVSTLIPRLMLEHFGVRWLEQGKLDVRIRRPVKRDEPIQAWAAPSGDSEFLVWCENANADRVIEGTASV